MTFRAVARLSQLTASAVTAECRRNSSSIANQRINPKPRNNFVWEENGLTYRTVTQSDSDAVWQLLTSQLYTRNPMIQSLGLYEPAEFEPTRLLIPGMIEEGVSLIVEDSVTKQLVGARLSTVEQREVGCRKHPLLVDPKLSAKYPKYAATYRMHEKLTSPVNLFQQYNVSKLLNFHYLAVRDSHTNRGIARKSVERSIQAARDLKLELVITTTVHQSSERLYSTLGFDRLNELYIPDFVDPVLGEKPFAKLNLDVLKSAVLFAKKL